MNKDKISALRSIYTNRTGYISVLRDKIGEKLLEEFVSVGFIICGYTRARKTWRLSSLGKSYVENLRLVEPAN